MPEQEGLFLIDIELLHPGLGQCGSLRSKSLSAYRTKGYRGGGKADKPAISGVWLMHGIGKIVAKLVNDLADLVVILGSRRFAHKAFKSASS